MIVCGLSGAVNAFPVASRLLARDTVGCDRRTVLRRVELIGRGRFAAPELAYSCIERGAIDV